MIFLVFSFLGFLGLFSVKRVYADTITLSGRITDSIGNPISGVKVKTNDVGLYTSTNSDGYYSFDTPSTPTSPSGFTNLQLVNDPYYVSPEITSSMPNSWTMSISSLNFLTDTIFNIEIPVNTVQIKVKYPNGDVAQNAIVQLYFPTRSAILPIHTSFGELDVFVNNSENRSNAMDGGRTDNNGDLTALVLTGAHYSVGIDAPVDGIYLPIQTTLSDQPITEDINKVYIFNSPPIISGLTNVTLIPGDIYSANASYSTQNATTQTGTVDYGDGEGEEALPPLGSKNFTLNHTYNNAGIYTVTVRVTDVGGATGVATATVTVTSPNNPPSISPIANTALNEGNTYSSNNSFTDPDSTSWTGTVDYGDGTGEHAFASPNESINPANHTYTISHLYKDNQPNNAPYTVTVKITDNQGSASGSSTSQVTVNNVSPVVGDITASIDPVQINTLTTVSATFIDPGIFDTHAAVWDWGDGTTLSCPVNASPCTLTEINGSGTVTGSHAYTSAGVYPIALTITDKDGGVGAKVFQYLSVYNPTSQGLFSAGQKFTSPAGAYAQSINLTGTVHFGLSYKYQGTVPVGNRQFSMDFNAANFHFNATSISSLVISNGVGTLRGAGTVNGLGTYSFLVTGDENTNAVRIQIKDATGHIVYDTQPGASDTASPTTIVTGNVLVH